MSIEERDEAISWIKADYDKPDGISLSYYTKAVDAIQMEYENSQQKT